MNDLTDTGTVAPPLADSIRIESVYTRAINLARDGGALELIAAYRPTSLARQCLRQMAGGLSAEPRPRALAAIGPYGVGKSACALFAGALLSDPGSEGQQTAARVLQAADSQLTEQITQGLAGSHGYLRVFIRQFSAAERWPADSIRVRDCVPLISRNTP